MLKSVDDIESINPWLEYWNRKNIWANSNLWRKQIEVFVRLSGDIMSYGPEDKVLDFGCGSGHFAEVISERVGSIVCADVSEHFLGMCRNKFAAQPNVDVLQISPDLNNLSDLGSGFTKVICFSVLHYFDQLDSVAAFVEQMQKACTPGAKLLIGDIGNAHRTWKDYLRSLAYVVREDMVLDVITLTAKLWLFDRHYRRIKQGGQSYLHIPAHYLETLGVKLGVKVTRLPMQFTVNSNYLNVLIEF